MFFSAKAFVFVRGEDLRKERGGKRVVGDGTWLGAVMSGRGVPVRLSSVLLGGEVWG